MLDHGASGARPWPGPPAAGWPAAAARRWRRCGSGRRTAARPRCSTTAERCPPWPGAPAAGWPAAATTARCGSGRRAAARPRCSTTAKRCTPWPGPPTAGWPAAACDGKVRIWPADGGPPQVLDHGEPVTALAWAPDGRLASGGARRQGADLASGRRLAPGARPRRDGVGPGLGPRRQAGQRRRRRQGADLAGGRRLAPGARPRRNGDALAWAPGGRLAIGGGGGKVRVWPADGGSPQVLDHGGCVTPWPGPPRQAGQRRRRRQGADLAGGRRPAPGARPRRIRDRPGLGPRRQAGQRRRRDGEVRIWRVSGHSDQLPGLQLPQSEFRFDRSCDALAVWSDRIACATGGSLALLRIIGNSESGTGS